MCYTVQLGRILGQETNLRIEALKEEWEGGVWDQSEQLGASVPAGPGELMEGGECQQPPESAREHPCPGHGQFAWAELPGSASACS